MLTVTKMRDRDWDAVRSIYRDGSDTDEATFETDVPKWQVWSENHLRQCRLVAKEDGQVVGWAALSPVSSRCVYAGVAEVSVYVAASARDRGIWKALLQAPVEESEREGIWTLQAGIFPANAASLAIHKACGFREVGYRERIGQLNGIWTDTLLLERRSGIVCV